MLRGIAQAAHPRLPIVFLLLLVGVLVTLPLLTAPAHADLGDEAKGDTDLPPDKGGFTQSLGMPPVYKGNAGFELQWYDPNGIADLAGYLNLGIMKDLGSPVVGIAALALDGYIGFRGSELDGGLRPLFVIPNFRFAIGADYNFDLDTFDLLLRLDLNLRRGGIFGRGSALSIRYLPTREHTFGLGISVPTWGSNLGKTRPKKAHVSVDSRKPMRLEPERANETIRDQMEVVRERARWIARLTQPFAEKSGADPHEAMQPTLDSLQAHWKSTDELFPGGHTINEEIRVYHEALERAFAMAVYGVTDPDETQLETGRRVSSRARTTLLNDVIYSYNSLMGQRKKPDTLSGMIAVAQSAFARWILSYSDEISEQAAIEAFYVFQTLCDIMEEMRVELQDRWEDSRFVFLPLQYGLKPEDHDTQEELNAIVARSSGNEFTPGNQVWYVINEEFQFELARSIHLAEDYHVLWIHDIRGLNGQKKPDEIAYAQVKTYLHALTERVRNYDDSGKLPTYMIFLDQHYFEINKSRMWLRLLREPLDYDLNLPKGYEEWEQDIANAQEELRKAVNESRLLLVEESQYGTKWLKNRIKIHVNITNPADPSFVSNHVMGILPIPDSLMRDHRKIAFYDVTEADPYKGKAMFTGMGVGEHYVGANWEDRAVIIQGPEALAVKDAARELMVNQGFEPQQIPYPLRPLDKPKDYDDRIAEFLEKNPNQFEFRAEVLQLHSETGYHDKPINPAKAALYSLMPSGSALNVPDSLWQSYLYASLLSGSALRGCRVLIIAPTSRSAPSAAAPTMARAHGLMGRLIVFSNGMDEIIEREGGLLKMGLYNPQQGVGDLASRFQQAIGTAVPWNDRMYVENDAFDNAAANAPAQLDSLGYKVEYLADADTTQSPKMHLKANLFASRVAWDNLMARPEWAGVLHGYVDYLAKQKLVDATEAAVDDIPDVASIPEEMLNNIRLLLNNFYADLTPEEKKELVLFMSVGSVNMDYRSMVMDGEVMILLSGWQSVIGFLDFLVLAGLSEWVETTEELDALLTPPGGTTRRMAGFMKLSL